MLAFEGFWSGARGEPGGGIPRGASVLRANAVIVHARRLATALATYRDSLDRDALREQRARHRISF